MSNPIEVEGLKKSYGPLEAVKGVDFEVCAGEVFGLLGPNGAGKTTTVEVLEGLRPRSGGRVSVLGCDPEVQTNDLKDRVGVCLQSTRLPDKIKVREAIEVFSALYTRNVDTTQLLKRLQLSQKREAHYSTLSGGQKQRLALALALLNDPQARLEIHQLVLDLRHEKRTILLTTHYIEEAEKLCDRVAIVDEGRIVAMGTPREIQERTLAHSTIEIECERPIPLGDLPGWQNAEKTTLDDGRTKIAVVSTRPARTIVEMVKWLDEAGIGLADIHIKRPSLEDAFIELTGKSLRE